MRLSHASLTLAGTVAAALALAAPAAAAPFSPPRATGLPAGGPISAAVGDDGGTVVAVRTSEGEGDAFRMRVRAAAGTLATGLGPAQTLAAAGGGAIRELQAVRPGGGSALVAWAQEGTGPRGVARLRYAVREAGGDRFGPVRTLARVPRASSSQLRVAAGPDGAVLAVWRAGGRLLAATARGDRFGAPRVLGRDGVFPSAASTGAGRWVVAWTRGPQRRRAGVVAELRGSRTIRRDLGPVLASAFVPGLRLAGAPDGSAVLTGLRRIGGERYRGVAFVRQVAPALGPAEPLGTQRRSRVPSLAAGTGGRAVVALLGVPEGARFAAVLGGLRPVGGPLAPVGILSRDEAVEQPRTAWAGDAPLVGWIARRGGTGAVVRVAVPVAGGGRPAATTVGEAGRPEGLVLAGSRAGALGVWTGPDGALVEAAAPAG